MESTQEDKMTRYGGSVCIIKETVAIYLFLLFL